LANWLVSAGGKGGVGPVNDPVSFGVRTGAIFAVIVGAIALGRWLEHLISRVPTRSAPVARSDGLATAPADIVQTRSPASRWLGRFALGCVLLAAAVAIFAIITYGSDRSQTLDLSTVVHASLGLASRVIGVLLLVPLTLGAGRLLQGVLDASLKRARVDSSLRLLAGRAIYIGTLLIGGLAILAVVGVALYLPVTVLTVVTAALALALQDVVRNLFAGVYLLVERPFVIGDEIMIAPYAGRVEDIRLRITTLHTLDGQSVLVPNALLFSTPVVNVTAYRRRRMVLAVTLPAAGLDRLGETEESISAAIEQVKGVLPDPRPQVTLNHAGQDKIDLRAIFWVPAYDTEVAQAAVSSAVDQVRTALAQAEVSIVDPATAPV
jgi:small conductance mechanosensitive channel